MKRKEKVFMVYLPLLGMIFIGAMMIVNYIHPTILPQLAASYGLNCNDAKIVSVAIESSEEIPEKTNLRFEVKLKDREEPLLIWTDNWNQYDLSDLMKNARHDIEVCKYGDNYTILWSSPPDPDSLIKM